MRKESAATHGTKPPRGAERIRTAVSVLRTVLRRFVPEHAAGYVWTQIQTTKHKGWVLWYLTRFCSRLMWRGLVHDLSKYRTDEASGFARTIFRLRSSTYGTDEYRALLAEIEPSIKLHYARNSHHPEHHGGQALGMPMLDQIEMIADWSAAVRRHKDGDLARSIEQNAARFRYGPLLAENYRDIARAMGSLREVRS